MNRKLLLYWGILSLMMGCSTSPEYSIKFCDMLDQQEQCEGDKNQFTIGQEIYVRFEFGDAFEGKEINGKICRITESDTIVLGDKKFELKPEDHYIIQDLPFHEFGMEALGNFIIRFEDGQEHLIAEKKLSIVSS